MTDDAFPAICELEFVDGQSGKTVTTRLGAPTYDPTRDWFCLSEITGIEEGKTQRLYGVDPFQAIYISLKRFRIILTNLSGDFRSPTGDAPHTVFPREIPWVYGSDVYGRLCGMVDGEVQKIEDERTRRRENRSGIKGG